MDPFSSAHDECAKEAVARFGFLRGGNRLCGTRRIGYDSETVTEFLYLSQEGKYLMLIIGQNVDYFTSESINGLYLCGPSAQDLLLTANGGVRCSERNKKQKFFVGRDHGWDKRVT